MNVLFLLRAKNTLAYVYDDCTLRQGVEKMRIHGYTAIPVITREGAYAGTISEGDFLYTLLERDASPQQNSSNVEALEKRRIRDILRRDFNPAVRVDVHMEELLERVSNQNFVPVVDDRNSFIGIVTRKDVIEYFLQKAREYEAQSVFFSIPAE